MDYDVRAQNFNATVVNDRTIAGALNGGVYFSGGGTIVSDRTIYGADNAVDFGVAGPDLRVVDPGAVFVGNVGALPSTASATLELASGAGSLAGIGSQFTGLTAFSFTSGVAWTLAGDLTGLASGEATAGVGPNDDIILNGSLASGDSFVGATDW